MTVFENYNRVANKFMPRLYMHSGSQASIISLGQSPVPDVTPSNVLGEGV